MVIKLGPISIDLDVPAIDGLAASLARLHEKVDALTMRGISLAQGVTDMSKELDDLTTKVQETRTVEDSAIALLNGLSARIAELATDPVALVQLAADLKSKSDELAAAVVANTPTAQP